MTNRTGSKTLKMSDRVFRLRQKVMKFIYDAKKIYPDMPRVEVRIVGDEAVGRKKLLGRASYVVKHISITEECLTYKDDDIRAVVFHELVHTLFGIGHDDSCPLMQSSLNSNLDSNQANFLFKKYLDLYLKEPKGQGIIIGKRNTIVARKAYERQ